MSAAHSMPMLEQENGAFFDRTISAATGDAPTLMRELNRVHQIVSGLGVVLRIVDANAAIMDDYSPDEPEGATLPPLSRTAESMLTAMAAAVCEQVAAGISMRASLHNSTVPA